MILIGEGEIDGQGGFFVMIGIKDVLVLIIVFSANILQAVTGFAGTILAMPGVMQLIGIKDAKVILNIVAVFVSASIAIKTYKEIDKKELLKISAVMLVGMAAGLYISFKLPIDGLVKFYGILIICVALKGLFIKKQVKVSSWMLCIILILAGIIHGMFLSGGALLVIYAVSVLKDKGRIRATLAPVWIILNSLLLGQDIIAGNFNVYNLKMSLLCIVPVLVALFLGFMLHKKINQNIFAKITYVLLVVSGITLLI